MHDLTLRQQERLKLGPTRFLTKTLATDEEFREAVREMVGQTAAAAGRA